MKALAGSVLLLAFGAADLVALNVLVMPHAIANTPLAFEVPEVKRPVPVPVKQVEPVHVAVAEPEAEAVPGSGSGSVPEPGAVPVPEPEPVPVPVPEPVAVAVAEPVAVAAAEPAVAVAPVVVPEPAPEPEAPAVVAPVGGADTVSIYFGTDRATIYPVAAAHLAEVAGRLEREPGLRLTVVGYTDAPGERIHNLQLSRRRVQRVVDALVAHGIDEQRVERVARGEEAAVEGRNSRHDRRVDLVFVGGGP